jgi:hypothetical protein
LALEKEAKPTDTNDIATSATATNQSNDELASTNNINQLHMSKHDSDQREMMMMLAVCRMVSLIKKYMIEKPQKNRPLMLQ